jgi:hypothetical protein
VRWKDRIYIGTKNGTYQVMNGTVTRRYRVEPNIDSRFILVTQDLPPRRCGAG